MSIYCLLVGINNYKANHISDLGGCENDVEAMKDVLQSRFNIPDENMLSLTNEQATRLAILDSFENHLGQAEEGDSVLFYYSGHGSQEVTDQRFWAIEDDHFNETLVCHDSRVTDNDYDLSNKELRFLIRNISKNKPRIVTIIDSCHSGGATRGFDEDETDIQVRQIPGSNIPRPMESYIFYQEAKSQGWLDDMTRMLEGDHIEMSACRNTQLSKEKYVGRIRHGVFTYYLQQTLRLAHDLPSYRNLNAIVSQKVQATVGMQHPQADAIGETNIHESFLADRIEPPMNQLFFVDGDWWVNAGFLQGINNGTKLNIIVEEETEISDGESCRAEVVEVLHDKSRIHLLTRTALDTTRQYQSIITDPAMSKLPVLLTGDNQQLESLRSALEGSKFLEESEGCAENAEYQIKGVEETCFKLSRVSGLPVYAPIGTAKEVIGQVKQMAYWEKALNLAYATGELPNDSVKVVIEQQDYSQGAQGYAQGAQGYSDARFSRVESQDNEVNLNYQRHNGKWKKPIIKIKMQLNPEIQHQENKLYVSLLFLDSLTGMVKVLANNINLIQETQKVWDGGSSTVDNEVHSFEVKSRQNNTFRFNVDDRLLKKGIIRTTDYLKLVITNFENDMSGFEQKGFSNDERTPSCIKTTGANSGANSGARGMDDGYDLEADIFIPKASTQTITLNTISPFQAEPQADGSVKISDSIRILPHDINIGISLEQKQKLSTLSTRSINDAADKPEIFENNPYASPLSLTSHRGLDNSPTVIRIDLPQTRSVDTGVVSEDSPLIIEVDRNLNENEQIIPYAKDGEFFIPLGYAKREFDNTGDIQGKTHIIIEQLPEASNIDDGSRSVGGSLLIYLQKIVFDVLRIENDTTRLAIPEFIRAEDLSVDNYEENIEILTDKVATADKILLFVHGILGDTKTMAGSINAKLADAKTIGDNYDVVLTFDYENLNTPIAETAEALIKKLAKLGLDESHKKQLDIVAHSMGGLVSRWMIEKNPAAPKINKLVMLGTPNGGSPLSDVKNWAFGALTLALNGIALTGIPGLTLSILGRLLNSVDETLDEMDKNSKTLEFLYEAKDPDIPYYLIAGDTKNLRIELDEDSSKLSRLVSYLKERGKLAVADLFTDKLFGEANDIAVSRSSMQHIPRDRNKVLKVVEIDCDHTSYFVDSKSIKELFGVLSDN